MNLQTPHCMLPSGVPSHARAAGTQGQGQGGDQQRFQRQVREGRQHTQQEYIQK